MNSRADEDASTGLLHRTFPHLLGILDIIPRPRWAAPCLVILGILASLAEALGVMLIPLLVYSLMNQLSALVANGGQLGAALRYLLARFHSTREIAVVFLLLIVVRGVLAYVYGVATAYISEQISQTTRDRVYDHYLRLPYGMIQRREQAELMEVLGRQAWLPSTAYTSLTRMLVNATFIIMLGGLLSVLAWKVMLCVALGSLLLSALLHLLSRQAQAIGYEVERVYQEMWDRMIITLQAMRTIRAFGREDIYQHRFNAHSACAHDVGVRAKRLTLLLDPLTEVGYLVLLGVILTVAPYLGASFATILTCVALLYRLQPHVREIEGHRLNLLYLEPQLGSVASILQAGSKHRDLPGTLPIRSIERGIRFDQVSFRYEASGPAVLDQLSFSIPAGVTTALVGASGSGKTTIVNLLLRLYEPDAGKIYVDEVALDQLRGSDWLRLIAVAGQDVDLFEGTVLENIRIADPTASQEAVTLAAKVAGIEDLLQSLPEAYDTWIGQHGLRFSGGERQRIGLARATLRKPAFLILDEAMNAMDLPLEQRVGDALHHCFEGATILVITHRMETVLNCEHVLCIKQGHIVAEGNPAELLSGSGSALSRTLAAVLESQ